MHASSRPLIVAHRGASADAPENTLPAFQLAWEQGADAIEGDFHLTRDRKIVCIHNPTTGEYATPNLTVRKSKLADLQALTLRSPHIDPTPSPLAASVIPTLAEVLATVPQGKKLYIEIKSSSKIVRHLLKEIDSSDISASQLVIIAFSGRVVRAIKRQRPSLKAILLATPRYRTKGRNLLPSSQQLLIELRRTGADGVSLYAHPDIDATYLAPFHENNYELHTWTIDDPHLAKKWFDLGALSITTNKPETLSSWMSRHKKTRVAQPEKPMATRAGKIE
ncbi:glycerophosphodiester phosphodiesterase family protein [Pelagicoccus sp. SDUM812002]|uniref:glycerophosphodiester phosphodiesterase family protein n=1 Tax=Pelagicoccus sp. SDUM812002 TaxID=3041266 RepID=UPI00281237D5|nr:glycerophosphodiester phosphodiesterase family protein [Pelagicoccus sp. SDUM812002]